MASFKTVSMRNHKDQEYQIELSLNDAAIMKNNLEIAVAGRYREIRENQWKEEIFIVRLVSEEKLIQVIFHDEIVGTINLNNLGDFLTETFDELETPEAWTEIEGLFLDNGGELIESAIQRIPAFDPVFGCLLKSGLSTAIGQLIECHSETRALSMERPRQRILGILRCLGVNSLAMAGKFTFRTLKCAAMGGWDTV